MCLLSEVPLVLNFPSANDYDDEVQILSLQAPSPVNPESAAIVIMNDNIAEVTEIFSVILFSNNDSFIVPIPTSTAEIYIIDTDCKFKLSP